MAAKRIKYGKEPVLHVHKYVVMVIRGKNTRYHYAMNLPDVRRIRDEQPHTAVVEVYKATHEFKEAWYGGKKMGAYVPAKKKL